MSSGIANSPAQENAKPDKEGWIRKRGGRMHQWSHRYFILQGPHISYKKKPEGPLRGAFDLTAGCALTEVSEDSRSISGKKLFSFWIVWPYDKHDKSSSGNGSAEEQAGGKDEVSPSASSNAQSSSSANVGDDSDGEDTLNGSRHGGKKGLKAIVESEVRVAQENRELVEKQMTKHQQHDSSISLGVKVAAVAVGGVVVGAFTAGIGLLPYIAVVGFTAVAGGGAVALQYRKPSDSRLILACETMHEAIAWKEAFETQIAKLEALRKPMLPASADPEIISSLIGMSTAGGGWRKVDHIEGLRILEQNPRGSQSNSSLNSAEGGADGPDHQVESSGSTSMRCRKAQIVIHKTPVTVFLAVMETPSPCWPRAGSGNTKVLQVIDDHADIIQVAVKYGKYGPRELILSRFWKLDDDGTYLITFNTSSPDLLGQTDKEKDKEKEKGKEKDKDKERESEKGKTGDTDKLRNSNGLNINIDAVMTVSPRRDHSDFDDDLKESLVTCSIQITKKDQQGSTASSKAAKAMNSTEIEAFMNDFLLQLVDLKDYFEANSFTYSTPSLSSNASPNSLTGLRPHGYGPTQSTPLMRAVAVRAHRASVTSSGVQQAAANSASIGITSAHGVTSSSISSSSCPQSPPSKMRSLFQMRPASTSVTVSSTGTTTSLTGPGGNRSLSPSSLSYSSPNQNDSSNSAVGSSNIPAKSKRPSWGIFRPKDKPQHFIQDSSSSGQIGNNSVNRSSATPTDRAVESKVMKRFSLRSSRRRSQTVNTEASAMRAQIAGKEYEAQRAEKLLEKQRNNAERGHNNEALISYNRQLEEINLLKEQYMKLTGISYDQSNSGVERERRRSISQGVAPTPVVTVSSVAAVAGTEKREVSSSVHNNNSRKPLAISTDQSASASASAAVSGLSERYPSKQPSHWTTFRRERAEACRAIYGDSVSDVKANLSLVTLFSLCMFLVLYLPELLTLA